MFCESRVKWRSSDVVYLHDPVYQPSSCTCRHDTRPCTRPRPRPWHPDDRPARNPVIPKPHLPTPEMHRETMRPGGGGVESAGRPASGRTPRPRPACWPSENRGGRVKVIRGHGNDQADGEPRGHQCLQFRASTYPVVLPVWLLMLWGPWVVHYKTPPVLLRVTKSDKNTCVWGGGVCPRCIPH